MFAAKQLRSVALGLVLGAAPLIGAPVQAQAVADQTELIFWETVRNTQDRAMLQLYLDRYPDGVFAPLADLMITQLQQGGAQMQAIPAPAKPAAEASPASQVSTAQASAMRQCEERAYHPWDQFAPENIGKPVAEEVEDLDELLATCRTAAETGDAEAQFHLYRVSIAVAGRAQHDLSDEGWEALESAASQGHETAQIWLARHLLRKLYGDRRDISRGINTLEEMVANQSAIGALELGNYHGARSSFYAGRDGAYDYAQAVAYLLKAEEFGDQTQAAYFLGGIYGDRAWSGFDIQAAAAAYDRAVATGHNLTWAHGQKGLLLATEGLRDARDWPPQDIVAFFHGGRMMEGLAALRQASKLEMVEKPGYWTNKYFNLFQDAFAFAADLSRSRYENNYLSWRASDESDGLNKVLSEFGLFLRDEMAELNAAQPGLYFGLGHDELSAWVERFKVLQDDQLRMFAELNEVKGWGLTFEAATDCVKQLNDEVWSSYNTVKLEFLNNCYAPVNFLVGVEFDKNTAGAREFTKQGRIEPDETRTFTFVAESDGGNSVRLSRLGCYDKQGGPTLYADGETYGCDWAFKLDEMDLVEDYYARRSSLVDHVAALLSDVVSD